MTMLMAQATMLKARVLTWSPIRSRRLMSSRMKIRHDGQPDAVGHLRKHQDFQQRRVGNQDDSRADDDQAGVERIERRGFVEFVVDAGFEAEAFADHVRGGKRQDRRGEERGVEQAEGEEVGGPLPCQRHQGFGGFARRR